MKSLPSGKIHPSGGQRSCNVRRSLGRSVVTVVTHMSNSPDHSWTQYGPSSSQSILSLPSSTCGSTSSSWSVAAGSWERTEGLPQFCCSLALQGRGSQAVLQRELWRPWWAVRLIPLWCHQKWEWPRWELKDESQTESVRPEIQSVFICVIQCLFY